MGAIEALYIFDEHNNAILDHVYTGRPPAASTLLPLYLALPYPRPSVTYLPSTSPPALLFSLVQDRLLFLIPSSGEIDPLLVLEFLHRVADALEDFLGSPLLASKVEANYDVVTQIVGELCDAGAVCNTEPNALKEIVEAPTWVGNLLGGIPTPSLQNPGTLLSDSSTTTSSSGSVVPWRRSNVRHTSNELYVDIVEKLSVILAPSGRPVSAFANGMIAFNAKISGVPDLLLRLTAPGGKAGVQRAMDLPSFHQCVRLARWREQPGELSFVPPDGRFVLAGYECDLLADLFDAGDASDPIRTPSLTLPASVEMLTSQGPNADELEVRLALPLRSLGNSSGGHASGSSAAARTLGSVGRPGLGSTNSSGTAGGPAVEDLVVSVPISASVRNITDIRCSKGEANYSPAEASLEWRISTREAATLGQSGASMRCTIVGLTEDRDSEQGLANGLKLRTDTFDYDEDMDGMNGNLGNASSRSTNAPDGAPSGTAKPSSNSNLMPKSASLSFAVRGWLASGVKVDSLNINPRSSKGLGAGVTPYKGVKYHTISRQGVEVRC